MASKYQRLRDLREDRDLSQQALADALGMYKTTYSNYELGKREIPFDLVIRLAKFYNVSIDYIAGFTNEPKKLTEINKGTSHKPQ